MSCVMLIEDVSRPIVMLRSNFILGRRLDCINTIPRAWLSILSVSNLTQLPVTVSSFPEERETKNKKKLTYGKPFLSFLGVVML